MLFEELSKNGLGTVADCQDVMPIIIQSFEFAALEKFATLSDLPLVMLSSYSQDYDWETIGKVAHAVGPASDWVMNPESLTNKQQSWDKSKVDNSYSPFIEKMHELELAVHPYTLQDDMLHYRSTAYDEAQLFVDKGVDGVFLEFPHSEHDLFSHMGSKANFPPAYVDYSDFLS